MQDGSIQEYDNNFSLLSPLICEAIAVKEDRRSRRTQPAGPSAGGAAGAASGSSTGAGGEAMEVSGVEGAGPADSANPPASSTGPSSHHLM